MFGATVPVNPSLATLPPAMIPRGMFARGKTVANQTDPRPAETQAATANGVPAMPGVISGVGGGTFDQQGNAAAPVNGPPRAGQSEQSLPMGPLGGSMRQPFDYDEALRVLAGDQQGPKKWQRIVGAVGDALSILGGGEATITPTFVAQARERAERMQSAIQQLTGWRHQDYAAQRDADLRAASPFTIGRDRVQFDPASGQSNVVYDGAEDFELYAEELGLKPGSEEYFQAVEDYVLRSSGPSAHNRDLALDDYRTGNDSKLENLRHRNRVGLEGVRQGNRVDLRHIPSARATGGRSATRPTATDGRGNKVEWNGSAWVPVR